MKLAGARGFAAEPAAGAGALVLHPRRMLIAAWIGAVGILVLFVVIAVLLRTAYTGVYFRGADQVALLMIGLFIAGGLLLVARPRVRADAAGIEVRNIVSTRWLPWDQVARVAFPDGASWARLDVADDEYLYVMAIQAVDGERAVEGIRAIRALHAAARTGEAA